MSGRNPLYERRNEAARIVAVIMGDIPQPEYHPRLPGSDPLWGLLRECWSKEPEERPIINIVLQKVRLDLFKLSLPLKPLLTQLESERETRLL